MRALVRSPSAEIAHSREMIVKRGVVVDHATVHRSALKILSVLASVFRSRKRSVGSSWKVDRTYKQGGRAVEISALGR